MDTLITSATIRSMTGFITLIESAQNTLACRESYMTMDGGAKQNANEFLDTLEERSIFDTFMPEAVITRIQDALKRMADGSQPHALYFKGDDKAFKNDTNGNDHYDLVIGFLNADDTKGLEVRTRFVETRDISGWEFEPSELGEPFALTLDGEPVTGYDTGLVETAWFDLMEQWWHDNVQVMTCPSPSEIDEAKDTLKKQLLFLRDTSTKAYNAASKQ